MMRWAAIALIAVIAAPACGGGSHAPDANGGPDAIQPCARGDDCNVAANSGCNDDDRCAVVQLTTTCFFPACEPIGSLLAGDPCTLSNNEGAESWDDCGVAMVCYQGVCTATCAIGGAGCTAPMQCMQDPDVGALVLGVCGP